MNDPCVLELARYRGPHTVDLLNSAAANVKEANDMTITAVDITAELGRLDAAHACAVSVDTIKRRLKAGAFPHARQVGLDRSWAIPVRDLVDAGLLPASALALPATPTAARLAAEPRSPGLPGGPTSTQLAEALAENRGLRAELARAQDEIAFLRQLVAGGRAA
ncbi:MAG: hypothetical protein Q8L05_10580 [Actinomycetota bacterium]|nr:hypothetical protein [Actinomycetota bacterium]MDP2289124.1 hypothetical protein [Actinomycetota bacterium]